GLVKRIRYLRLGNVPDNAPPVERELSCWAGESVFTLARGERTPFFCTELPGDPAQLRVFSYTRLVHPDPYAPWKGLVRLEVLAKAGEVVRLREAIGAFFDSLCNCLPNLSGDYVWKRLPENLFPMIALEEHLSLYFLPPVYMRTLFNRLIRRD
ncbi:MAG TPA: hypothetical protein VLH40_10055, partial [Atribacteraceae bacterium]|nr:hypothetical protein [Atribacteraceae bacterium]